MKRNQRIATASVTVLCAAVTAHLMQRSSNDVSGVAAVGPAQSSAMAAESIPSPDTIATRADNPVTVVATLEKTVTTTSVNRDKITPEETAIGADAFAEPVEPKAPVAATPVMIVTGAPSNAADDAVKPLTMAEAVETQSKVAVVETVAEVEPNSADPSVAFPDMPRPPVEGVTPDPLPQNGADLQARMASVVAEVLESADAIEPVEAEVKRNAFGLSCGALLTASPKPAAMVGLTLTDPCRGGESFTLEHGVLSYTATLNDLGTYMADIPALSANATFTVRFSDDSTVEAEVNVPTANEVDRAALFTDADSGLAIHALEFGADYDQDGHIWSGNPRNADSANKAGGGFVTVLGDTNRPGAAMAQIYTFPTNTRYREGVVRLSIESEVTALNCGKDVAGQTLQIERGSAVAPVSVTLAMPDCEAIGEFLVLKNLLRDLKIASN